MAQEKPLRGSEYARAFYDQWDFVKHAVCLYTRSIAWKGAAVWGFTPRSSEGERLVDIPEETLLEIVPAWFIDGHAEVRPTGDDPPTLQPASTDGGLFVRTIGESFGQPDGGSLLWPACANYPAIQQMSDVRRLGPNELAETTLKFMLDDAKGSLYLPQWAYEPDQAAQANMWGVASSLEDYRLTVERHRRNLLYGIRDALKDWLGKRYPKVAQFEPFWNRESRPSDAMGGWDGVYLAFQQCGVPLTTFGEEFPAWLRQMEGAGLPVPDGALKGWADLGL